MQLYFNLMISVNCFFNSFKKSNKKYFLSQEKTKNKPTGFEETIDVFAKIKPFDNFQPHIGRQLFQLLTNFRI